MTVLCAVMCRIYYVYCIYHRPSFLVRRYNCNLLVKLVIDSQETIPQIGRLWNQNHMNIGRYHQTHKFSHFDLGYFMIFGYPWWLIGHV